MSTELLMGLFALSPSDDLSGCQTKTREKNGTESARSGAGTDRRHPVAADPLQAPPRASLTVEGDNR